MVILWNNADHFGRMVNRKQFLYAKNFSKNDLFLILMNADGQEIYREFVMFFFQIEI